MLGNLASTVHDNNNSSGRQDHHHHHHHHRQQQQPDHSHHHRHHHPHRHYQHQHPGHDYRQYKYGSFTGIPLNSSHGSNNNNTNSSSSSMKWCEMHNCYQMVIGGDDDEVGGDGGYHQVNALVTTTRTTTPITKSPTPMPMCSCSCAYSKSLMLKHGIDGNSLSGICSVGLINIWARVGLLLIPFTLSLGIKIFYFIQLIHQFTRLRHKFRVSSFRVDREIAQRLVRYSLFYGIKPAPDSLQINLEIDLYLSSSPVQSFNIL
ncbi:unnamed protein product [Trichobilharzia regenti]|nr:unnamed protein product [Trichobilharzia regenti]